MALFVGGDRGLRFPRSQDRDLHPTNNDPVRGDPGPGAPSFVRILEKNPSALRQMTTRFEGRSV